MWAATTAYVFEPFARLSERIANVADAGRLVERDEIKIAKALVESSEGSTTEQRLVALAHHPVAFVLALVADRRKVSPAVDEALASAPVLPLSIAWMVAKRTSSPSALAALARADELNLRSYIAANKHTALDTLERLMGETFVPTLGSLAAHPNADDALLRRLASADYSPTVFTSLAKRSRAIPTVRPTSARISPMSFHRATESARPCSRRSRGFDATNDTFFAARRRRRAFEEGHR